MWAVGWCVHWDDSYQVLRKWEFVNTEVGRGDCRPGQLEGESPVNYPWGVSVGFPSEPIPVEES